MCVLCVCACVSACVSVCVCLCNVSPAGFTSTSSTSMVLISLIILRFLVSLPPQDWCGAKVADAVIAVPSSFSDFQRNCLRFGEAQECDQAND